MKRVKTKKRLFKFLQILLTHHFAYHIYKRSQVDVQTEQVQQLEIPKHNVRTVYDATGVHGLRIKTQTHADNEVRDGEGVVYVPVACIEDAHS